MPYSKVVFMADFLKIDDRLERKYADPNTIHVDWLYSLLGQIFQEEFGLPTERFDFTDTSRATNRFSFYSRCGLPFNSSGWAMSYHGGEIYVDQLTRALKDMSGALVIGFELSPTIREALNRSGATHIDLSVHPIRFMSDYLLGFRASNDEIMRRALELMVPVEVMKHHARVSRGRSARIFRNRNIVPGAAVFLGQIQIDSSLIHGGRIVGEAEIIEHLNVLKISHSHVYYKFHPHYGSRSHMENILKSIGVGVLDVNIYDLFDSREVDLFCAVSSGSLQEAKIFGRRTLRLIPGPEIHAVSISEVSSEEITSKYIPIPLEIYSTAFWRYLLIADEARLDAAPDKPQQAFKFMINQKWGR